MKIFMDFDYNDNGEQVAVHVFETDRASWNKVQHPDGKTGFIDAIDFLKMVHTTPALADKAGFMVVSKHPNYKGYTRLDVVRAEMKRQNDPNCAVLGI
jgi:hypothetical protein